MCIHYLTVHPIRWCTSGILLVLLVYWKDAVPSVAAPPNFIFILTDDQSWVGTSTPMIPDDPRTKSDYYDTPNIDRLASMGMVFTQGYAPAPFCDATRRSLHIGQSTPRHIFQKDQEKWTREYREQLSIPRMLKLANPSYRTAHLGKWDLRFDRFSPAEMGYDVSDGITSNPEGDVQGLSGPAAVDDPKLIFDLTDRATAFIAEQAAAETPFFIQLSHYAVHLDIYYTTESLHRAQAREPGKKHTMAEFTAMTDDMDRSIGMLLDQVESLGLLANTYIIFMSDNGGRRTLPDAPEPELPINHPLREGKGTMYEGGIRVPFFVAGPGIKPGSISHVPITGLDIFPTLAELSGYKEVLPESIDGGSLVTLLHGDGTAAVHRQNPFLIFHQANNRIPRSAIRWGDFKLVRTAVRGTETSTVELFNLAEDIGETTDLSSTMPEKTRQLEAQLDAFLESVDASNRFAIPGRG